MSLQLCPIVFLSLPLQTVSSTSLIKKSPNSVLPFNPLRIHPPTLIPPLSHPVSHLSILQALVKSEQLSLDLLMPPAILILFLLFYSNLALTPFYFPLLISSTLLFMKGLSLILLNLLLSAHSSKSITYPLMTCPATVLSLILISYPRSSNASFTPELIITSQLFHPYVLSNLHIVNSTPLKLPFSVSRTIFFLPQTSKESLRLSF